MPPKQATLRLRASKKRSSRAEQLKLARLKRKVAQGDDSGGDVIRDQVQPGSAEGEQTPKPSTSKESASLLTSESGSSLSSSAKKLKLFKDVPSASSKESAAIPEELEVLDPDPVQRLPTTVCDLNEIANLFAACACPECGHTSVQLSSDPSKNKGLAVHLTVVCTNCDHVIATNFTSSRMQGQNSCFEVNRRSVVGSILCGYGAKKFNKFCEYLDLPGLGSKTFHKHCDEVYATVPQLKTQLLEMGAQVVRQEHNKLNPELGHDGVLDIAVSVDGRWLTRGHTSNVGLVCVIDMMTNVCIDFHVLSKYCQKCETTGKKKREVNELEYQMWYLDHQGECQKNFEGSSGMMEVEGAKVLFQRSMALHNIRYTTVLSDGDFKAYNELCEIQPYGPDIAIEKEECVNHISKRLGTALRNLVADNSKRGIRLGGRGRGKLAQATITKLQSYYTKAIRSNCESVDTMENAVWASYFHCLSTDEEPRHRRCPVDANSWCFYNRAIANNQPPPPHAESLGTAINADVAEKMVPVYRGLGDRELLKRCLRSKTQNANENLHSVIWSRCPKETFGSRSKVEVAALISVGEYNMGSTASHNLLTSQGLGVGANTKRLGQQRDSVRHANCRRSEELKTRKRREKVRQARLEERRRQQQAEGGPAYVPGGF